MKQKIKVYQVQVTIFDKNGDFIPKYLRKFNVVCVGTVITPNKSREMVEESIWDLFNWTCWGWGKLTGKSWIYGIRNGVRRDGFRMFPTSYAQGYCNSDIFFYMNGKWYAAAHCGFKTFDSEDDAIELCKENIRN